MLLHLLKLFRSEAPRLLKDRVPDAHLAHVVQSGITLDLVYEELRAAGRPGDELSVQTDPADMIASVRVVQHIGPFEGDDQPLGKLFELLVPRGERRQGFVPLQPRGGEIAMRRRPAQQSAQPSLKLLGVIRLENEIVRPG